MLQYIAVLDHDHLDNSLFLSAFASALAHHTERRGIILHGDSEYTTRIMQHGVIREEAEIRAIKDLNHRLVALFADHGVSTIGLHGYQKQLLSKNGDHLLLDTAELDRIHPNPCLLISNLVDENGSITPVPLVELSRFLATEINESIVVLFSSDEREDLLPSGGGSKSKWSQIKSDGFADLIPKAFNEFDFPAILTTASSFKNWPNPEKKVKIT